ncbi:GIY-YIG nuclease family protein [Candidatus Saccharibacteria bacterium]|nr:GIY-YIG nuclease family protein [Candidatus Saccharibacteria bacterium]
MQPRVYILHFPKSDRYYVGSTNNLARRLERHLAGHTHSTKRLGSEFRVVFTQDMETLEDARKAEYRIKSWKRRDFIEKIINDGKLKYLQ